MGSRADGFFGNIIKKAYNNYDLILYCVDVNGVTDNAMVISRIKIFYEKII